MTKFITVRIYFEYGQKLKNISFWKKLSIADFATELIKKANTFGIDQALNFNISKGYFEQGKIHWGMNETKHFKHPHVIEITDTEEKINSFLKEQKLLFKETKIVIVKNEILIHKLK
tara:strand:- start:10086 stop:10436 length:351 start_codon:yes stop_codon:yes gene_type:complete